MFEVAREAYSASARCKRRFELASTLSFSSRELAAVSSALVCAATAPTDSTQSPGRTLLREVLRAARMIAGERGPGAEVHAARRVTPIARGDRLAERCRVAGARFGPEPVESGPRLGG